MLTAPRAVDVLQRYVQQHGPDLILDMARLDFIDSKGVGALLSGVKASRDAGGTVYLQNAATPVKKILEMCGLLSLFPPRPERKPEPAAAEPAPPPRARPTSTAPAARPSTTAARTASTGARPLKRAA